MVIVLPRMRVVKRQTACRTSRRHTRKTPLSEHRIHTLSLRAGQDTTPAVHATTPAVHATTNKYKEERLIEEVWISVKETLKTEITSSNYQNHLQDTHAVAFNRDTGTLVVAVSSRQAATQLNNYFAMTIRRAIATTNASIHGVPIAAVDFIPRPPQLWDLAEDDHPSP